MTRTLRLTTKILTVMSQTFVLVSASKRLQLSFSPPACLANSISDNNHTAFPTQWLLSEDADRGNSWMFCLTNRERYGSEYDDLVKVVSLDFLGKLKPRDTPYCRG